ncbi:MAG TPA: OmpH family outer membrane protein [Sphingomonas sp.]|nr:OmpH family outer membrane protein [Sphingomonas sp.]
MKPALLAALVIAPFSSHAGQAQPPVATAPASPTLGGPAIAGVCLLSRPAVFATARVGVAATARLQQLTEQAKAEVEAERKPIEADAKAFEAEQARLSPEQRQSRAQALEQRLRAVQQKAALRSREIEATREKAMTRIVSTMQPLVQQVYQARGCGLLVDRGSVLGGNMTNDLTPAVIQGLDARMATISFDREALAAAQ